MNFVEEISSYIFVWFRVRFTAFITVEFHVIQLENWRIGELETGPRCDESAIRIWNEFHSIFLFDF